MPNYKEDKEPNLQLLDYKINTLLKGFEDFKANLEKHYLTKQEFEEYQRRVKTMENIMYTIAGTILLAFLGAIINLII